MIDIEELKNLADDLDMWGYYLGKRGQNRRYKCPFNHEESNKNLSVKNNSWHCFSCGEGGDIIKLVQKMYSLSFKNAVIKICQDFKLEGIFADKAVDLQHIEERRQLRAKLKARQEKFEKDKMNMFNRMVHIDDMLETIIDELSPNGRDLKVYSYSKDIDLAFEFIQLKHRLDAILDFLICRTVSKNADNDFIFDLLNCDTFETKESYDNAVDKIFKMLINGDLDLWGDHENNE